MIAAAIARAIAVARLHEGATAPNPAVGCVLLDAAGTVLIAAAHPGAGQPHAAQLLRGLPRLDAIGLNFAIKGWTRDPEGDGRLAHVAVVMS